MKVNEVAHTISNQQKELNELKRTFYDTLNQEIKLSLPEISREARSKFGVDLEIISVSVIDDQRTYGRKLYKALGSSLLLFGDVELQFAVEGRQYWVGEYTCNILRVFLESRGGARPYQREEIVKLYVDENKNRFLDEIECSTRKQKIPTLKMVLQDLSSLQESLDGKIETILSWVKERTATYALTSIRETKQKKRMLLHARKNEDGLFATLPLEIVEHIFQYLSTK